MKFIASQPYITVTRKIDWNKQHYIENKHFLHLYEDKIITVNGQFLIEEVWDMSYKASSSEIGILYFHTNKGLFSFQVKTDPNHFIALYKSIKQ